MLEVQLPQLEEYQKALLNTFIEHQTDTVITVSARRQIGKSIGVQVLLIWASLNKKGVSLYCSPTQAQSRKAYNDIVNTLNGTSLLKKRNDSLLTLTFCNDSTIMFKSSEQKDALRGFTVSNVLVVDEASFIPDSTIYELLWPMTNVWRSTIILVSTPKFKKGAFYESYIRGVQGLPGYITINYNDWDTSKYLSAEKLEMYRMTLPKLVFQSEYLGEFISGEGAVFDNFRNCVGTALVRPELPLTITVDWSGNTNNDYNVLTFGQVQYGTLTVFNQQAWNNSTTQTTIDRIINAVKSYVDQGLTEFNIIVEKNSIGQVYFQLLVEQMQLYVDSYNVNVSYNDEIEVNCSTFITTQSSKDTIIKQLSTLFEHNKIVIPADEQLLLELSIFEAKQSNNGQLSYSAPTGMHDDRVMSLAFQMRDCYNTIM